MITKSSAGSGKTHNLALRYLQSLLQREKPTELKNILAITFTNKAAQEMRVRIIDWMKRASLNFSLKNDPVPVTQRLGGCSALFHKGASQVQETSMLPDLTTSEISSHLEKSLDWLLRNYHDFKVLTIDSFNTFMLKSLAFMLDLSPEFEILLDPSEHVKMALEELYSDILVKPEVRDAFDRFIDEYAYLEVKKLRWNPDELIKDLTGFIWEKEREKGLPPNRMEEGVDIRENHVLAIKLARMLKTELLNIENIKLNSTFLKALENCFQGSRFIPSKLSSWLYRDFERVGSKPGLLNKGSAPFSSKASQLLLDLRDAVDEMVYQEARYKFAVVSDINTLLQQKLKLITSRDHVVLINEFNILLRSVLETNESGVPEIPSGLYLYLAERYHHFLIDEFQDTNTLQWNNLESLITNALSEGGSLFVVGDEKQSIYRWRGGNFELVNRIIEGFSQNRYPVEQLYRLDLNMNYRSSEAIVIFNNALFTYENLSRLATSEFEDHSFVDKYLSIYKNAQQETHASMMGRGYVYAELFDKDVLLDKDHLEEEDEEDDDDKIQGLDRYIKKRLLEQISEVKKRHALRDIAVLTGKNDQANKVVRWLLEAGYPVESELTVSLKTHPFVNELMAFLKFINDPTDNIAFMSFVTGEIFTGLAGLEKKEVFSWINNTLIEAPGRSLYFAFKEGKRIEWDLYVSDLFKYAGYMPLYEFVALIMKKWDLFNRFKESSPYFLRFLEVVQSLGSVSTDNLADFIGIWDTAKTSDDQFLLKSTESMNAIRVLTVHKSKGLEFSVVFVPFAGERGREDFNFVHENQAHRKLDLFRITKENILFSKRLSDVFWEEKTQRLMDEINDLYVALTRPREALFVYFASGKNKDGQYKNLMARLLFKEGTSNPSFFGDFMQTGKEINNEVVPPEQIKSGIPFSDSDSKDEELVWFKLIRTRVENPEDMVSDSFLKALKGKVIHSVLAKLKGIEKERWKELVGEAIREHGAPKEPAQYIDVLEKNFSTSMFSSFFSVEDAEFFSEKEIVTSGGALKRVDRFIVYKDRIVIVDFKTGQHKNKKHEDQVLEYGQVLGILYPHHKIEMYISYLDSVETIRVEAQS